jgi:sugar lactone lactonase YvrE
MPSCSSSRHPTIPGPVASERPGEPERALKLLLDGLSFPEGPRWHDGKLWFVDAGAVQRVDLAGNVETVTAIDGNPSGSGFLPDGDLLVVSMRRRRLMRMSNDGVTEHADLSVFPGDFLNDMVVDGAGYAYVGTRRQGMQPTLAPHDPKEERDALLLVAPDGTAQVAADGLISPNGAVITPDGATLIVAETYGHRLTCFDRAADGSLHGRRVFAEVPGRFPDGIGLDEEGAVWFGSPYTDEFVRVAEGGVVLDRVPLVTGVACTLGGPGRDTLFLLEGNATYLPHVADCPAAVLGGDDVSPGARIWTMTVPHSGAGWP